MAVEVGLLTLRLRVLEYTGLANNRIARIRRENTTIEPRQTGTQGGEEGGEEGK